MEAAHPASSKILTDELIDIFGQNEQEILNFVGVTNDADEYELHFTKSAEILDWERDFKENAEGEGGEEQLEDEALHIDEDAKERALVQIQAQEAKIAADINKYLNALKTKESLEFEQISREEIFEKLKCKCFEWNRIKKKETIKDVIKQICRAKTCQREMARKDREEKRKIEQARDEKTWAAEKNKKKKFGVCTGLIKKRNLIRKEKKHYTKKDIKEMTLLRDKISRETIKTEIKKFAAYVTADKSRDDSSSSDDVSSIKSHEKFLRAKDSVLLRKDEEDIRVQKSTQSSTESASSTVSGNLQHLESFEKIEKRKIHPTMFNMYLNEFNSIKNFAFVFVDNILQEAESKANVNIIDPLEINIKNYICPEYFCGKNESKPPPLPENTISLYSQVYGYDLTPHEGKNMVRDVIKYWKVRKSWKYCVNFLGKQTDSCSNYYKYEVKWSEPTFSYPIPQVTASVFFTIELSRVKPTLFPPKVTFVFETERYKFTSYDDIAHEKFLDDIIDCKTVFFKSIRF